MLSAHLNKRLTEVGAGTPMGDLLRRYWHPVAGVEQLRQARTKRVRLLGEDLVLFRGGEHTYGLIAERCEHRGCSLFYGIPGPDGLRCSYHGWLYSPEGACLEQPAESDHSRFRDRVRINAYPVRELGGLLFAYLGPAPAPVLPPFDVYTWPGAIRQAGYTVLPVNWLQPMENSLDPVHFEWLHGHYGNYVYEQQGKPPTSQIVRKHLRIGFDQFEWGIIKRRVVEGTTEDDEAWRVGHPIVFPNILRVGRNGTHGFQVRVPVDDENTLIWWYSCFRPSGVDIPPQDSVPIFEVPYQDENGELILDTVEGQDMMAWLTQGRVADRTTEHLGASDRGVVMYRQLLVSEMAKVAEGKDPIGVIREPPPSGIVELPQEEELYYRGAEGIREDIERGPGMRYSPILDQIVDLYLRQAAAHA
ncbi:aromatic ring-hydroxylating dioxygenase subunit alpha [Rugosimonospora acidiphila]|uniref:Aromatic ring-hydroxylating dioxygenase subunit alpha n=1 Tax=Rugosimonospora acidiphila TaxID=556531 RepID=A0ABP9SRJ5_9ACTN